VSFAKNFLRIDNQIQKVHDKNVRLSIQTMGGVVESIKIQREVNQSFFFIGIFNFQKNFPHIDNLIQKEHD
jgi:hypothetical protein